MEGLKIQIHSAQKVGKVQKILLASFGAISGRFSMDRKDKKKKHVVCLFSLVGQYAAPCCYPPFVAPLVLCCTADQFYIDVCAASSVSTVALYTHSRSTNF